METIDQKEKEFGKPGIKREMNLGNQGPNWKYFRKLWIKKRKELRKPGFKKQGILVTSYQKRNDAR